MIRSHLVRTVHRCEVEKSGSLSPDLRSDPPDLVVVEVEEVQTAVVLIYRMVVVMSPEKIISHLVPLVETGGAD